MIKLSDYVMNFLVSKGVRQTFMLPGGGAMHLDDSLGRNPDLHYVCFLHEQALAIAAEAYGQHTNTPGVGIVTSGPGATNTVTGVAAAYIDSTPCLFISGQAKRADLKIGTGVRQMGSQEVDIVSIVSPITKYAAMVLEPAEIRYHLEKAWHCATTGRMGPVWLDIPLDVQAATIDESALRGFTPEAEPVTEGKVSSAAKQIVDMLNSSKRPLILVGNGVKLSGAQCELYKFAEKNSIPVLLTWKTIDMFDYSHPLNFGSPGLMGNRAANFIVQNSDFLLIMGSRLDPSITAFNSADFGRNARKVMVDIDESEIRKIKNITLPIVADVKQMLSELNARQSELSPSGNHDWLTYCAGLKAKYPVVLDEYRKCTDGINLYVFTDELFKQLTAEDVIVPESSGAAGEVTYQAMRVKLGQKIRNAAGLGSMGFGLPYSIGACIANDRRRTILINGDGAFQLNIQELETIVRLKLPVKMFIWDNNGYGSIMATQRNLFGGFYVGSDPSSGLTLPDVCAVAKAYGIRTETVESQDALASAMTRVLAGKDPVLCRIRVAPSQFTAPRVQAVKLPDGNMMSKPLEDMWPYLDEAEVKNNMKGVCL
ncbi:MAG: thiamine pyrophosphate-binding protein [Victivallaceae bacterium]|jgi:acetolactate synthase-1/2/3 large subunit